LYFCPSIYLPPAFLTTHALTHLPTYIPTHLCT
jgi:hypothetical protein